MSETARLEIMAESGGAARARSGAKATRSSSTPNPPVTTKAIGTAANQGSPSVVMQKSATNAPSMKTVGWARFRMSRTLKTSAKPSAKSA